MSKAGDYNVPYSCIPSYIVYIITSLFAFNSTGGHAYIACTGVEPQKKWHSTSGPFHKICEGKSHVSPFNIFVYTWPVVSDTKFQFRLLCDTLLDLSETHR